MASEQALQLDALLRGGPKAVDMELAEQRAAGGASGGLHVRAGGRALRGRAGARWLLGGAGGRPPRRCSGVPLRRWLRDLQPAVAAQDRRAPRGRERHARPRPRATAWLPSTPSRPRSRTRPAPSSGLPSTAYRRPGHHAVAVYGRRSARAAADAKGCAEVDDEDRRRHRRQRQPWIRRRALQVVEIVDQAVQRRSRPSGHILHARQYRRRTDGSTTLDAGAQTPSTETTRNVAARGFRRAERGDGLGMDRERATPEDLGPLELRKLRDLDLEEPSAPGRPAHVSAASGVARRGDFVYVIGDDELHLGVFRLSSNAPGRLRRVLGGELPDDHSERSSAKPDLEALTLLPPFESHPYGALLGLGSGSAPRALSRLRLCPRRRRVDRRRAG